jgi:hypothetical protein
MYSIQHKNIMYSGFMFCRGNIFVDCLQILAINVIAFTTTTTYAYIYNHSCKFNACTYLFITKRLSMNSETAVSSDWIWFDCFRLLIVQLRTNTSSLLAIYKNSSPMYLNVNVCGPRYSIFLVVLERFPSDQNRVSTN